MDTPNIDRLDSRIEELLKQLPKNHSSSLNELFSLLEAEIRKRSKAIMGKEIGFRTLQTTALVNELWVKLFEDTKISPKTTSEFLAIVFRKMNQTVIDIARSKETGKRGAGLDRVAPEEIVGELDGLAGGLVNPWLLVDLDRAVDKLSREKADLWPPVFWTIICGYTGSDVAKMLGISEGEVSKRVKEGNAWFKKELAHRT